MARTVAEWLLQGDGARGSGLRRQGVTDEEDRADQEREQNDEVEKPFHDAGNRKTCGRR